MTLLFRIRQNALKRVSTITLVEPGLAGQLVRVLKESVPRLSPEIIGIEKFQREIESKVQLEKIMKRSIVSVKV